MSQEKTLYISNVSSEELREIVRKWFRVATLVLVGKCRITYRGRASSEAGEARRLVVIKEDGTVLVHEGKGREPINWQPQARVVVREENPFAVVEAVRTRPREYLKITFTEAVDVLISRLSEGKFLMFMTESDLVEKIARRPSLIEDGCTLVAKEVSTPHGRVDLILRGREGDLIVVEVKRSLADVDAAYQLIRYVEYYRRLGLNVRGVLVSPRISPTAFNLLSKHELKHVKLGF